MPGGFVASFRVKPGLLAHLHLNGGVELAFLLFDADVHERVLDLLRCLFAFWTFGSCLIELLLQLCYFRVQLGA